MTRPSPWQFEIAIAWLHVNDGDNGECEACQAVAKWLEENERNHFIQREARRVGIPTALLRRRLEKSR